MSLFPDIDREEALEDELQIATVDYLYGLEARGLLTFSHSPNEGDRTERERHKLVAMGMRVGHPDIDIYLRGGHTIFLELKTRTGWVGPKQKVRHALLQVLGFDVHLIKAATPAHCISQITTILAERGVPV